MKTKKPGSSLHGSEAPRESDVQQEIESFIRALRSYPDRFAREPYTSFQQHLSSIATEGHPPNTTHSSSEHRHRSG